METIKISKRNTDIPLVVSLNKYLFKIGLTVYVYVFLVFNSTSIDKSSSNAKFTK